MTDQLKQEIISTLTPDCFPCKITDVEEFVRGTMANVSTEFFLWVVELAQQAEDDEQLDHVYNDVYELFSNEIQIELMRGHNFTLNKEPR